MAEVCLVKLPSDECYWTLQMISQCSGLSQKSCRSWSEFWEIPTFICKEMCKKFLVLTKSYRSRPNGPALVSNTVISQHLFSRARRFPLPDGPGQAKLPVRQVDLNRVFLFNSYKQIDEFQNSWSRAGDDFEKRQAVVQVIRACARHFENGVLNAYRMHCKHNH